MIRVALLIAVVATDLIEAATSRSLVVRTGGLTIALSRVISLKVSSCKGSGSDIGDRSLLRLICVGLRFPVSSVRATQE